MVDQDKVTELYGRIMAGVLEFKDSERYKQYLKFSSAFRRYSWDNQMLIWIQKPDATMVAGFRTWQNQGRYVKRGEKGIAILAPSIKKFEYRLFHDPRTGQERVLRIDAFEAAVRNRTTLFGIPFDEWYAAYQDEPDKERETRAITRFLIVYVFDVSQTEGRPVPTITDKLSGTVITQELFDRVAAAVGIPIRQALTSEYATLGLNGFYNPIERFISLRPDNPLDQKFKTLIHEWTHAQLDNDRKQLKFTRGQEELIAESSAYIVSDFLGLDTSAYTFGYLAGWSEKPDDFERVGGAVNRTANEIITKLRDTGILPAAPAQSS